MQCLRDTPTLNLCQAPHHFLHYIHTQNSSSFPTTLPTGWGGSNPGVLGGVEAWSEGSIDPLLLLLVAAGLTIHTASSDSTGSSRFHARGLLSVTAASSSDWVKEKNQPTLNSTTSQVGNIRSPKKWIFIIPFSVLLCLYTKRRTTQCHLWNKIIEIPDSVSKSYFIKSYWLGKGWIVKGYWSSIYLYISLPSSFRW